MKQQLKEEILSLAAIMSVSGFEGRGGDELRKRWEEYFDEIETDAVGNHLFIKRCGREGAPLCLVDTHFDEVGLMVTKVLEGGFLRVTQIGGLSPTVLQAADVIVWGETPIRGVITSTPPHLRSGSEEDLPNAEELMIDTGYPKEELEKIAPAGTPVGFAPGYSELLSDCLAGKSFDNKACAACAVLGIMRTPREKMAADVALLLSAYEETSRLGGATPAARRLSPDYAMVIDVNLAKVPDTPKYETVPLGEGVSISVSAATDRTLTAMTRALCEDLEIPHTMIAAPSSTGTNAPTIHLAGRGVPVVDVGLPLKNMHTYNEVISLADAEALTRLVAAFIGDRKIAEVFDDAGREELL